MLSFLHFLKFILCICNPFIIKKRKKLLYNRRTQFCSSPKSTLLAISSPTLEPAHSYYIMCQTAAPFFKHTGMEERKTEAWRAGCYYRDTQGPGNRLQPAFQHIILQPLQVGTCTRYICMCVYMSMLEQYIEVTPPGTSLPQYSPQHQARTIGHKYS